MMQKDSPLIPCRFLNTIIDDLFAFVIKMPTLHRLSVFRDDLGAVLLLIARLLLGRFVTQFGRQGSVKCPIMSFHVFN